MTAAPAGRPAELIGIRFSPWTEKARWALDHHRVPYRYTEHLILLGMPELRMKTGKLFGDVTVPALITKDKCYLDSFEIAEFASGTAPSDKASSLFPADLMGEIRRFNTLSEEGLDAGRALLTARIAASPAARLEQLPPFVPKFLRGASDPVVALGLAYINREFGVKSVAAGRYDERLEKVLIELSNALGQGKRRYILDRFSYADIVMAVVLQFVTAVDRGYIPVGPATKDCMTHPRLARDFAPLLEWRNRLYENHRRGATN